MGSYSSTLSNHVNETRENLPTVHLNNLNHSPALILNRIVVVVVVVAQIFSQATQAGVLDTE